MKSFMSVATAVLVLVESAKGGRIRGSPFEDSDQPVSDLEAGRYIVCKARRFFKLDNTFLPNALDDDKPIPLTLDIDIVGDGFEYTGIVSIPTRCAPQRIPVADCAASGTTTLKYYFIAAQSFLPEKKNEITFDSHYATYLKGDGTEESIEVLGDKETSTLNIVVKGKQLFSNDAYHFEFEGANQFNFAQVDAIIWAKEEDGCDDE